jgi:glycosyltransferase involved in cell wall biosynthesis
MDIISVIVPCYNEEQVLPLFIKALYAATSGMTAGFEFIFVDDGSADATLSILQDLSKEDSRVKFISFSRNFGKEAAMFAGLEHASGDFLTVIDADLQHSPELIKTMYGLIKTGEYDCIATKRASRAGEPRLRLFFTHCFYRLINSICKVKFVEGALDSRLMTRQVKEAILAMKESGRFIKGIYSWVGFRTNWIECESAERAAGVSKWSLRKLFAYSLEGIVAFSSAPLFLSSLLGLLFCLTAFILFVFVIVRSAVSGAPLAGFASTLCVIFLVGGVQLLCTGLLGLYVSKTHTETRKRPLYLVKETNMR